jgi:hypothetical protein
MTLGNMQIIFGLILMIVLGSCKETSTPVVNLTSGTLRQVVPDSARPSWLGPVDDRPERNTFSIQVDFDKKTLSVDGSEPYELSNSDGSTITFKGEGFTTGSINRITGNAQITESLSLSGGRGGPYVFYVREGTCKSVGKLF